MLDWLKRTAQQASSLATEYSGNQSSISALIDLPEAEMIAQLQARLASMNGGALTRFIAAVGVTSAGALLKVQRLSPQHATQHASLRPASLPTNIEAKAAVERLYKVEALARHLYAYAKGDQPASVPPIAAAPLSPDKLPGEIADLLRDFERRLRIGESWKDCQARFDRELKALGERVVPGERPRDVHLVMCRGLLESYRIGRAHHPPEFAHTVAALEGIAQAAERALETTDEQDPDQRVEVSSKLRKHFQALDSLFIDQVWLGKKLSGDPYAKLLAFHFRELGRALVSGADLMDTGDSQDAEEHKRLLDRFQAAMLLFADHDTDAAKLRTHEQNVFRQLAIDLRGWLRRDHVYLAKPSLPMAPVQIDRNTLFYSGGGAVKSSLERAGTLLGLRLSEPRGHGNPAHARCDQLRGSHVAVFDFTAYQRVDDDGPIVRSEEEAVLGAAAPIAAVAYELGWASALGVPILVVEHRGQSAPFDVDVEPVRIENDAAGTVPSGLVEGLWRALYAPQHVGAGTSVGATIDYVAQHYAHHSIEGVRKIAARIGAADYARNTTKLHGALDGLVSQLGAEAPAILMPSFPGRYPTAPSVFFAGAFREWARPAHDAVRRVCQRVGMEFLIGYERIEQDIIRAIWNDLCSATHVVVDITNLNPNAAQELGMVHAIGRDVLIISQNVAPHAFFPAIAKMRIHHYDPADARSMTRLAEVTELFLTRRGAEQGT
jgi:hypothetical protein